MDRERITNTIKKGYDGVKGFFARAVEVFKNPALLDEANTVAAAKQKWKQVGHFLFFSLAGFLFTLTKNFGESRIFGVSLLCAATSRSAAYVFAGSVCASFCTGADAIPCIIISTLIFVCRILISYWSEGVSALGNLKLSESLLFRCALSCAGAFIYGVYKVVLGGFSLASVGLLLLSVLIAPALTYLLACSSSRQAPSDALREAGSFAVIFCTVFALSKATLLGFHFAYMVSFLLTVYFAVRGGLLRALSVGMVCGIALDLSFLPIFAFCGLCAGALRCFGSSIASSASLAASILAYLYIKGAAGILDFSGNLLFAQLIFLPFASRNMLPELKLFVKYDECAESSRVIEGMKNSAEKNRMAALSSAFDELSKVFLSLSERVRRPGAYELTGMCDRAIGRYCKSCALSSVCWQKEFESTNDVVNRMVKLLKSGKSIEKSDLPEYFKQRCRHLDRVIADVNASMAETVEKAVQNDKTELFALDYEAMAELLSQAACDEEGDYRCDAQLQKNAVRIFRSLGVNALGYGAWGVRKKTVVASGIEIAELNVSANDIKNALEEGTGISFSTPRFDFDGDYVTMTLESKCEIELDCWYCSKVAENEKVSGDTVKCFSSADNRKYALICDGMGSGYEAATVSRISAIFLEKMLSAGNKKEIALKMLSNFLRARAGEYHSTVDICEVDLYEKKACFVKSGASSSYLLRGQNIYKIDVKSMPVGVTREINASRVEMVLESGDTVVMTSDGVSSCFENSLWLPELIVEKGALSVKELCFEIQKKAEEQEQKRDDVSICVFRVKDAREQAES